jgi:hypothetical protein
LFGGDNLDAVVGGRQLTAAALYDTGAGSPKRSTEPLMRLAQIPALATTAICLSFSALADQCDAIERPQAFKMTRANVKLEAGATILDRPGGKALARVGQALTTFSPGVSTDGCWWQILLPNGDVGYVSAKVVMQENKTN